MSYYINYDHLKGQAKIDKAIKDIKAYIGADKYEEVTKIAKQDFAAGKLNREFFVQSVSIMAGIEGYPLKAWADQIFGPEESVANQPDPN